MNNSGDNRNYKKRGLPLFLESNTVQRMLNYLENTGKISKEELKLRILELCPVILISRHNYLSGRNNGVRTDSFQVSKWSREMYEKLHKEWTDLVFKYSEKDDMKLQELVAGFPNYYVNELTKIACPYTYIISFTKNPTNAVMWASYAKNTGVCLEYRSNDKLSLKLPTSYSERGVGYSWQKWPFIKTAYVEKRQNIFDTNFFTSISRLQNQYAERFFIDSHGNISPYFNYLFNEHDRDWYWKKWTISGNTKMKRWDYEEEYRILIQTQMSDFESSNQKTIQYDPTELKSITFGNKTPEFEKKEIRQIVRKFFRDSSIEFYQQDISEHGEVIRIKV